ncbi:Mrp/NBP35 family ATP-binding protein [Planctomicrobium piriforme]|uniref:Iron-sulfur cluster carrier protein n=1 Tax=Planctomicrobium piriforme TaxID=1576369 RepID=A0A1I3MX33_9PLAN|nr:Mrp/NBP35 family ATP-binding protein [Planctomicrobium piriforme]SFJ01315.1 ATP-binding protein involved in chromosome partitioning [Planctomicrobium piriforme]
MPAVADILKIAGALVDPVLHQPLSRLKMLKSVNLDGSAATVTIELPTPAYPAREKLTLALQQAIQAQQPDVTAVDVQYTSVVKGKQAGANIGLKIKNIIAVGSGKGGVGKSTVAASIAYGLQHWGAKVGLMDADVYGPSVPHLCGATGQPAIKQYQMPDGRTFERIEPIEADGLKVISMGFMVAPDQAVIWRGPMLHKALSQFLQQTDWGELDYLVIDMPPGTGDVALTLSQMVSLAGAVIVCTPQQVALLDAGKAITMFNTVKIPILGMVENMTGEIFGRGGAKVKAGAMGIPFLGEVPSNAIIRIRGDEGRISSLFDDDSPVRQELLDISSKVAMAIAKDILENPAMPTLELL